MKNKRDDCKEEKDMEEQREEMHIEGKREEMGEEKNIEAKEEERETKKNMEEQGEGKEKKVYIAHKRDDEEQSMLEHLKNVAKFASEFAISFGMEEYAYTVGMAHDIGKYSDKFQRKIKENTNEQVDHSTAGAKELSNMRMIMGSMAVAGHHGGLADAISYQDTCWQKRVNSKNLEDYSKYKKEVRLDRYQDLQADKYSTSFMIRMLFSCLVDADFLDTEGFMQKGEVNRGGYDDIACLYNKLQEHIAPWRKKKHEEGSINSLRNAILEQCIAKGKRERGVYSLTVPTGAGKTVSSLAFALEHAKEHGLDRVIYVIPYTSIIEQNADVFRGILGDKNVVEHHSNTGMGDNEGDNYVNLHRLSTENWDARMIVTTNVQFFESLYSNKVSKCRKLHNIANSVIIFDEAQMIPLMFLKPCVKAMKELVDRYHVSILLCTATQPALGRWFAPEKIEEICENTSQLFEAFKRTNISYIGEISKETLASEMAEQSQVLTIVNTRKQAQEIYQMLPEEGRYHLSTMMTPVHRKAVIQQIKNNLSNTEIKITSRVVSTSLVEAGVDVDFPRVYRAEAGLDSIIQAAGRCNREGGRALAESMVKVFRLNEKSPRMMEKNISMMWEAYQKFQAFDSIEAIQYYFEQIQRLDEDYLDYKHILHSIEKDRNGHRLPFAGIAEDFKLMPDNTVMVIIPKEEEAKRLEEELRRRIKEEFNFKETLRKLGMYSVNVPRYTYEKMDKDGVVEKIAEGVSILMRLDLYDDAMGLHYEESDGYWMV